MFKISFLVNFDNYKGAYFFNLYKKVYNFILNNSQFKNDLKLLENNKQKYKLIYDTYNKVIKQFNEKIIIKKNFIKPISDEPIGLGNDILGNEDFAKNIYDLLNGINFKEFKKSYSIGIVGEWGGGKSSIINLLDEQYLDGNPNFKVLKFNPWDYKKENLINNFFGELSKILGVKDVSNLFKNYLKLVGNIDSNIKIGTDFLSGFIGNKSLEEIKKEIDKKLKNYGSKIVIIIDDLDRCEPDEVLMMLNLIKNLGDFNNIIYLVSYDKQHIIQVLEDKKFSHDYIEKIINIERFIPIPGKEELKKYFEEKFTEILENLKKENKELFDKKKKQEIINYLIEEFDEFFEKENLRFIKKLLNHLNVILQLNLEKENSEIENLSNEDFKNIFIINYCKLKDYKLFSEIFKNFKNSLITPKGEIWLEKEDISLKFLNITNLYIFRYLFKIIFLLSKSYNKDIGKYIIRNNYLRYQYFIKQKDFNDEKIIDNFNICSRSIFLLKYYS